MRTAAQAAIPREGWGWHFLTFTTRYNPCELADLTWEALRVRARGVSRSIKAVWDDFLKVDGAGLVRAVEISSRGHVHGHVLYYGPSLADEDVEEGSSVADLVAQGVTNIGKLHCTKMEAVARKAFRGAGSIHSKPLSDSSTEAVVTADRVAAAAQYMAKSQKASRYAFDEDWLSGQWSVMTIDPILAARWEIACYKVRLIEKYGFLRGLEHHESKPVAEVYHDGNVPCKQCGEIGKWETRFVHTESYVNDCHWAGEAGMKRSTWKPRWMRKGKPPLFDS